MRVDCGLPYNDEDLKLISKLNRVRPETLRELAYKEIRWALLLGNFVPGEVITVRELANALGLGLTPVREGVQLLSSQGALEFLPNRSVRVPTYTAEGLKKLFEARILNESYAAEQAVPHLRSTTIRRLHDHLEELHSAIDLVQPEIGLKANFEFHFTVYRAAQSPYLLDIVERLWLGVGPLHAAPYRASPTERAAYAGANSQHRRLMGAIEAGDGKAAGEAVRDLLRYSLGWYLRTCVGGDAIFPIATGNVSLAGSPVKASKRKPELSAS